MHYTGIIIGIGTFLIIGIFHPIVIKTEYYTGTRLWWVFLLLGIICIAAALFIPDVLSSSLLGVTGASFIWSIGELFEQRERVKKGWFPMNPRRKADYYYEIAEFIDLIQSGRRESEINSHNNSLLTMEIIDEIRRQIGVKFPADENPRVTSHP